MQNIWNRTSLVLLLPLLLFMLGISSNADASTTKKTTSKTTHTVKKPAHKATRTVSHSHKTVTRKTSVIYHRERLHTANRVASTPAHAAKIDVALRHSFRQSKLAQRIDSSDEIASLTHRTSLLSESVLVQDVESSAILYSKNSDEVRPIASISKLMTALVIAEAQQPLDQMIEITDADVDRLRHSRSRLQVGSQLTRTDMLHLALMSSENRAAHALARYYPGGMSAFVRAMNDKARSLGMRKTHFIEPTGLSSENVSTPRDLIKLLRAASKQPLIHRYTTDDTYQVEVAKGRQLVYNNSNSLVRNPDWHIQVSKTGFINEAGECLVMLTQIDKREVAIVLLNSTGRYSRVGDAMRVRQLVEKEIDVAML
jgi:D-alanyl-D-alanine endopeptidase (penicillin-binding protein 7)